MTALGRQYLAGRAAMTAAKPSPKTDRALLDRLVEAARNHVMTPAEIEVQRKSWVIGNLMLDHPEMTRAEAEAIYNRVRP